MYTVCRVKRSEEKASRTLFITNVGKPGIFLTCYDGKICSFLGPTGERKMPARGGPSINYSSTLVGSRICGASRLSTLLFSPQLWAAGKSRQRAT